MVYVVVTAMTVVADVCAIRVPWIWLVIDRRRRDADGRRGADWRGSNNDARDVHRCRCYADGRRRNDDRRNGNGRESDVNTE